jgi:AbrB family looped-hinge helix DNA binding protein
MAISEPTRVGRRGTLVLPAALRRRFGLEEGSEVVAEETPEGILIRPAVTLPVELYSPERRAELLLSNATDPEDYRLVREVVQEMGLDPDGIPHEPPGSRR